MGCPKLTYQTNLELVKSYSPKILTSEKTKINTCRTYTYSFQGQEHDDEAKGEGNSINYKYRMHDPRVGRFFALDPLASKYPHNSPYAFSENRVLDALELEGLEAWEIKRDWEPKDEALFQIFTEETIKRLQEEKIEFDCADLAVYLLIEYAYENGLNVSFTSVDNKELKASDPKLSDSKESFTNIIKGSTNALSIMNDMKYLDKGELPAPGDMTNSETHVNIISDNPVEKDYIPSVSGSIPARVPKNSKIATNRGYSFMEWKVIDAGSKKPIPKTPGQLKYEHKTDGSSTGPNERPDDVDF